MKTVYFSYIESPEVQGMFDEKGKLISLWYCNDANWRNEYFSEFMKKLGIEVVNARAKSNAFQAKCQEVLEKAVEGD